MCHSQRARANVLLKYNFDNFNLKSDIFGCSWASNSSLASNFSLAFFVGHESFHKNDVWALEFHASKNSIKFTIFPFIMIFLPKTIAVHDDSTCFVVTARKKLRTKRKWTERTKNHTHTHAENNETNYTLFMSLPHFKLFDCQKQLNSEIVAAIICVGIFFGEKKMI